MAGTLGRLAGNRLILGVGIGYLRGEFEILGVPYSDRAVATESWVESVRTPPHGFSVVNGPEPTPIWIGGNSLKAIRRAALFGDGWHPLWMPPEKYGAARQTILDIRAEHHIAGEFTFSFSAGMSGLASEPSQGWPAPTPRAPVGSEFRYAPAPWVAPDGRPRLVGSPDDLIADLQSLSDAGVEHITMRFGANDPALLERFAREVMPGFSRSAPT
jgi:alkanesulfonate monooxygenase SsuD/methylene tetrahydromethanopterin reductase-like flavin-dependent oxidoreductase (luciferase family)